MDRFLQLVPSISKEQVAQLVELEKLIKIWNENINVISRKDIDKVREHHIIHSLSIAHFFQFPKGSRILDVGTGGGFPGIPLAILFPDSHFLLVDSIRKKIGVVQSIIEELGLKNCTAVAERVEKLDISTNIIVSRAVAPMGKIMNWTRDLFADKPLLEMENCWLFLKGGDLTAELATVKKNKEIIELNTVLKSEHFDEKFLIKVNR